MLLVYWADLYQLTILGQSKVHICCLERDKLSTSPQPLNTWDNCCLWIWWPVQNKANTLSPSFQWFPSQLLQKPTKLKIFNIMPEAFNLCWPIYKVRYSWVPLVVKTPYMNYVSIIISSFLIQSCSWGYVLCVSHILYLSSASNEFIQSSV